MLNVHSLQTATWANFFSTNSCIYLSAGRSFSLIDRFWTQITLARWVFLVPTLRLNSFLYKAMENCQLGDSNLAGSIFIFLHMACCQRVRAGGQGYGILSFIPSCAINLFSNLRWVGFVFWGGYFCFCFCFVFYCINRNRMPPHRA